MDTSTPCRSVTAAQVVDERPSIAEHLCLSRLVSADARDSHVSGALEECSPAHRKLLLGEAVGRRHSLIEV